MSKTNTTMEIEQELINIERKNNYCYCCQEVSVNFKQWSNTKFVDVLKYNANTDEFTCLKIKITRSDFKSKNGHNFVGDKNYYVVPTELVEFAKEELKWSKEIGIIEAFYTENGYWFRIRKHSKVSKNKVDFAMRNLLMFNLMKSLYREKSKLEEIV